MRLISRVELIHSEKTADGFPYAEFLAVCRDGTLWIGRVSLVLNDKEDPCEVTWRRLKHPPEITRKRDPYDVLEEKIRRDADAKAERTTLRVAEDEENQSS